MNLTQVLFIIWAIIWSPTASGTSGEKEVSSTGFIEFYPGTLNVILSAPHGGILEPASIQERDAGCLDAVTQECIFTHTCGEKDFENCKPTTVTDLNTKEVALLLREELYKETGKYPYVVINNLKRIKMDANRDKPEATFGVPVAEEAWEEYHRYIDQSKAAIGGRGLFLDIHGQGHPNNWSEIGYLISKTDLDLGKFHPDNTSIRYLASQVSISFEELLRGATSFGGFLQENEFRAVPSPGDPSPRGEKYYRGGYNTRRHGSLTSGQIDAIQIEASGSQRSSDVRPQYARALSRTVTSFLAEHYSGSGSAALYSTALLFSCSAFQLLYLVSSV